VFIHFEDNIDKAIEAYEKKIKEKTADNAYIIV
jgi:hypothetical protein